MSEALASSARHARFAGKKARILRQLAVPDESYADASPKGSVDEGIRDLISQINELEGLATTSSCAGRVTVFLEGKKTPATPALPAVQAPGIATNTDSATKGATAAPRPADIQLAGVGGKGGGGQWLYVSHEPFDTSGGSEGSGECGGNKGRGCRRQSWGTMLLGIPASAVFADVPFGSSSVSEMRLVHFKFEPMILHIIADSLERAQQVLRCGLQAGFRESGAINLTAHQDETTPMVAIRSMGLAFESLVGVQTDGKVHSVVSPEYLGTLVRIANERFHENGNRIERFRSALQEAFRQSDQSRPGDHQVSGVFSRVPAWEDVNTRRERKRAEGLQRSSDVRHGRERRAAEAESGGPGGLSS